MSAQVTIAPEEIPERFRELPSPRIWTPKNLADFCGFSVHWVYKKTQSDCSDPVPRCKGMRQIRFDTKDPKFQEWLARQLEAY
jgi:hypothetical protein